jgi:hypothetical protein
MAGWVEIKTLRSNSVGRQVMRRDWERRDRQAVQRGAGKNWQRLM